MQSSRSWIVVINLFLIIYDVIKIKFFFFFCYDFL